jgi:hypothetical protein
VRGLVVVGKGSAVADVDVYRDGEVVTVIGRALHQRETPFGAINSAVEVVSQFPSIEAFDWAKARAFERAPLAYTRVVGALGIDDDAMRAPPLPQELRHLVARRLGQAPPRRVALALVAGDSTPIRVAPDQLRVLDHDADHRELESLELLGEDNPREVAGPAEFSKARGAR